MLKNNYIRNDLRVYLYPDALLHNIKALKTCCEDNVKFCAVVKANAYGHGICEVVDILRDAGVDFFAIASIYEAFHIVEKIDTQQILVLEPLHSGLTAEAITQCAQLGIQCTISSRQSARYVSSVLTEQQTKLKVHINVDTGMGRCGVETQQARALVEFVYNSPLMELAGIYTHFATADKKDLSFAREQLDSFKETLKNLNGLIDNSVVVHAANSPATIRLPESHFDMVRCGIGIYGYSTLEKPIPLELKPALKFEAPIVHISTIEKGRTVSYGRTFAAEKKTKIAVLPIGYSDGFCRFFSNNATVLVNNKSAPIIGRVTMNQIVIDVTDIPNVQLGQFITIIDDKYDSPCGVYALAETSKTICYEILTNIPPWVSIKIAEQSHH